MRVLVLLLAALCSIAYAQNSTCVLRLTVDGKASPFTIVGKVVNPLPANLVPRNPDQKLEGSGYLYLALPSLPSESCPPAGPMSAADAPRYLAGARLVSLKNDTLLRVLPESILADVQMEGAAPTDSPLATMNLTNVTLAVSENNVSTLQTVTPGLNNLGVVDVAFRINNGTYNITSAFGNFSSTLANETRNGSLAEFKGQVDINSTLVTISLKDGRLRYNITSADLPPGQVAVDIAAIVEFGGNVTAVGDLARHTMKVPPSAILELPVDSPPAARPAQPLPAAGP